MSGHKTFASSRKILSIVVMLYYLQSYTMDLLYFFNICNYTILYHTNFNAMKRCYFLMHFNPIRSGPFQTANDPGGGGFKSPPPPLGSRKLLCQSSLYHTCAFYQVFQACSNWNFSKICDFDHFTAVSKYKVAIIVVKITFLLFCLK